VFPTKARALLAVAVLWRKVIWLDLSARLMMHRGFLIGRIDCIFCFAPGILNLALYLLNHAFNLQTGIAGQFTSLALDASHCLIKSAFHSIFIHEFSRDFRSLVFSKVGSDIGNGAAPLPISVFLASAFAVMVVTVSMAPAIAHFISLEVSRISPSLSTTLAIFRPVAVVSMLWIKAVVHVAMKVL
jgi:hypothetical protein